MRENSSQGTQTSQARLWERWVERSAQRQYGHVTRGQLLEIGFSPETIRSRVRTGRLIAVHRGVYAVGHLPVHPAARAAAAVLACGPGAVLSHTSAAALWGIVQRWPERTEVTVPGDRQRPEILVHRSTALTRSDLRHHLGIRVTSPARTALDVAPRLTNTELVRAINDARHSRYLKLSDLAELLTRFPRHPGTRLLLPFVNAPAGPTRSEFEDAFVAFARRFELPAPEVNIRIEGYLVDALFADQRLIVELDGWEFHGDHHSFQTDRERDAATLLAGYATVRITWERLNDTPQREATRLHAILRARQDPSGPSG